MSRNSLPPDDSWENDAVWKLLDQAPAEPASYGFADNTVRAVRLEEPDAPWWHRLFGPLPLGFATTTVAAALVIGFFTFSLTPTTSEPEPVAAQTIDQSSGNIAAIEDIAETEVLISAVDRMDDYSDHELVTLIGF